MLYEQQSAIRIAALAKEVAELRALADRASDTGEKWKAELAAERERRQLAVEMSSGFERQALTLAAELKQTEERACHWIAEAARLKHALERAKNCIRGRNAEAHIAEIEALERKP